MKKSCRSHISSGICGSRQKEQGLCVVSCMQFLQYPSLQVVAGRGPISPGVHCSSGFKYPLSRPEQPCVSMQKSPLPPMNLPVFWQKVQVMGRRSGKVRQQSSSQLDLDADRIARERIRQSCSFIVIDKCIQRQSRRRAAMILMVFEVLPIERTTVIAISEPFLEARRVEFMIASGYRYCRAFIGLIFSLIYDFQTATGRKTLKTNRTTVNLCPSCFGLLVEVLQFLGDLK